MALDNFSFPSVTLKQTFAASTAGGVATLGAAVIGSMFKLHRHDEQAEAAKLSTAYTGSSITESLPGMAAVNTVDSDTKYQKLCVVDGAYSYYTEEDTASITVADGIGTVTSTKVLATNSYATADTVFGTRGVKVGDTVILTGTSVTVKTTVIALVEDSNHALKKFVVADYGSFTGSGVEIDVDYCLLENVTYDQGSSTFAVNAAAGTVTVQAGLSTDVREELGKTTAVTASLKGGDLYIEYRERNNAYVGSRGSVAAVGEIEAVAGPVDEANPLALALYFAVAAAGGNYVYFTAVKAETVAGYTEALAFLDKYNTVYSVVPATTDTAIVQACAAAVVASSENEHSKIRRSLWYGLDSVDELELYSGTGTYTAKTGTEVYNKVQLTSNVFNTYPLQEGDYLWTAADGFVAIAATNGFNTAYVTPTMTFTSSATVRVVRKKPTNAQIIDNLAGRRGTNSYRCQCVWADGILFDGSVVPNYCGAAAAAGMRSYEECWRPMSNLAYSFFSVKDSHGFTLAQLEELGSNGIWIIDDNDSGVPVNKKAITTAVANDVNKDNESVISNIDEIALVMCHVGEDKVGNSNISDLLLMCLRDDIDNILSYRMKNASSDYVGNQLLDYQIIDIWQDEVNKDQVYADMTVTPPKPFNQFHMTMRVI